MSCGVGCKRGSDPALLWLCCRLVATTPIRPLAWESPYAVGLAQEMAKRPKNKQTKSKNKQTKTTMRLTMKEQKEKLEKKSHLQSHPKE